ncbi:hypothetical protein MNV49_005411 [Pseudohyphozyma bogoriensis]|nr:hypothetical protein MNV49_005411 [Pseudohyphozyma bogoriensis]
MSAIQAIDSSSIHRLTSGQVVIDLQTAVKELLENALDADASSIEIKFKEYGVESIEVTDNGKGIDQSDWPGIARKHHTSKLTSFDDLTSITSLGFRGEALSSLCGTATLSITTSTAATAPIGTNLTFTRSGECIVGSKSARSRGTTVAVGELFKELPVRRKELIKNGKREFGKAVELLTGYAVIKAGVKIVVKNSVGGKWTTHIQTQGGPTQTLRNTFSTLFTQKALAQMMDLSLSLVVEPDKTVVRNSSLASSTTVEVQGLISQPTTGSGRTSSNRQFYYLNGRPFTPSRISKAFNEVYKSFNIGSFPCVVANFILPTDAYDVNVSPDKRTIFLNSEGNLITALKAALEELFQPSRSTYEMVGIVSSEKKDSVGLKGKGRKTETDSEAEEEEKEVEEPPKKRMRLELELESDVEDAVGGSGAFERGQEEEMEVDELVSSVASGSVVSTIGKVAERTAEEEEEEGAALSSSPPPASSSTTAQVDITVSTSQIDVDLEIDELASTPFNSNPSPLFHHSPSRSPSPSSSSPTPLSPPAPSLPPKLRQITLDTAGASWAVTGASMSRKGKERERDREPPKAKAKGSAKEKIRSLSQFRNPASQVRNGGRNPYIDDEAVHGSGGEDDEEDEEMDEEEAGFIDDEPIEEEEEDGSAGEEEGAMDGEGQQESVDHSERGKEECGCEHEVLELGDDSAVEEEGNDDDELIIVDGAGREEILGGDTVLSDTTVPFDMDSLVARWRASSTSTTDALPSTTLTDARPSSPPKVVALAGASVDQDLDQAEATLSRVVSKEDFEKMRVIGQFNLGFIIARRKIEQEGGQDDLFIIDQHASDEKYNFEKLQADTTIVSQKLLQPRTLNLPSHEEIVAMENVDMLRLNGFEVLVDEDAEVGQRVKLLAQPVSKDTVFGVSDFEELLDLISAASTGEIVRPTKTRRMFASRACRKSVMIGKALNVTQMTSIVRHMGGMEQPWACPHGRPTMRWTD